MNQSITRNLSMVAIFICALSACPSNTPTTTPKPFKPTLSVAASDVVAGTDILVRSAYSVIPDLKPQAVPTWTQPSGPGALEALDDWNRVFHVFPSDPVKVSTVETRYNVAGQSFTTSVTLRAHPAPTIEPSADAGLNALSLAPYSFSYPLNLRSALTTGQKSEGCVTHAKT